MPAPRETRPLKANPPAPAHLARDGRQWRPSRKVPCVTATAAASLLTARRWHESPEATLMVQRREALPPPPPCCTANTPAPDDCFQSRFGVGFFFFIYFFYWDIPARKEAAARVGAGSLPATSAVIRLYSSGFRKQKHVYYQATNQADINLVKAKLKQSFRIIFWFRSHLLSQCKYFLQIMLREW